MPRTVVRTRSLLLSLLALVLALLGACTTAGRSTAGSGDATPAGLPAPSSPIVIDGDVSDWPRDAALLADSSFVYFRVTIADAEPAPLQGAPRTLGVWLDVDASAATGASHDAPAPAQDLGIDYEIHFSPMDESGEPTRGTRIIAHTPRGAEEVSHDEFDLVIAPTHAGVWYEGRVARSALGARASGATDARAMFVVLDENGPTDMWSDLAACRLPAHVPGAGAEFEVPMRGHDELRVLSWNVLRNSPVENAGPFERTFRVLAPDVVLVQEWRYTSEELRGWFTALVPATTPWHALSLPDEGVGIVSRYPITPAIEEPIVITDPGDGEAWRVRCVAGIVHSPVGDVGVASVHLKCCGTAESPEDRLRVAEARGVNELLRERFSASGAAIRVIGGDLNAVGTPDPVRALAGGLDADASSLAITSPRVVGDATHYTWFDASSDFVPGRLDYLLVSDASAEVTRSFVFDTARLSERTLARLGLDPTDSRASDHLPVVADIRPRR